MNKVSKGVFITTSSFSKEIDKEITGKDTRCRLIDGKALAELLLKYEVGVSSERTFKTYVVDNSYFPET